MTAAAARLREPLRAPVLVGLAGAVLAAALLAQDPHAGGWPGCVFLRLTGIPCPGCGGLRASHDLLTADLGAALSTNAYAVLTAALVAIGYAAWLAAAVRGRAVFDGKGRCRSCHVGPNFTDEILHNTGLAKLGAPSKTGAVKTPTLRAIRLTAPYFHDGSAATLAESGMAAVTPTM